jgi:hypothetical protein
MRESAPSENYRRNKDTPTSIGTTCLAIKKHRPNYFLFAGEIEVSNRHAANCIDRKRRRPWSLCLRKLPRQSLTVAAVKGHYRTKCVAAKSELFNHLVGAVQERWRHGEAEHFRGLEIDDQQKFGRKFDWQITGRGAFENFVDVNR